ncbi:MAG: deoxyribose-phosphate aldolase [Bacteroidota bacterium]
MYEFKPFIHSQEDIKSKITEISARQLSAEERSDALKLILSSIDLTTLEATDTESRVQALCEQAKSFPQRKKGAPAVAAVCVYPPFASLVKDELAGSGIRTACVATAFPSGQATLPIKLMEVSSVVIDGAEEVDMVISRGKFLEGELDEVAGEIRAVKAACGEAHLKVILETGELDSVQNIRKACEIALLAGADFLKTSTGKIQPAATPEAFFIMLESIKEFHAMSARKVGIKAAGGIADPETALQYYALTKEVLGSDWLTKELFRIGASRLAESVFNEL